MVAEKKSFRRQMMRMLAIFLVAYVGVLLVLMWLENQLVYHPRPGAEPAPSPEFQDVSLTCQDGICLHAWWLPCEGSSTALLYLHGNGGNLSIRGESLLNLREKLNTSVLILDYPGYGKSLGRPSEQGCYRAADAGYDWLVQKQNFDPNRIILYGASLGGGVAVDLASRKPHQALVLVKTFTSLPDVGQKWFPYVPVRWMMRNRYDNLAKIGLCKSPLFMAHGQADEIVPYALGKELFEKACEPKFFFELPEGYQGHNDRMPREYFTQLRAFLEKHAPVLK